MPIRTEHTAERLPLPTYYPCISIWKGSQNSRSKAENTSQTCGLDDKSMCASGFFFFFDWAKWLLFFKQMAFLIPHLLIPFRALISLLAQVSNHIFEYHLWCGFKFGCGLYLENCLILERDTYAVCSLCLPTNSKRPFFLLQSNLPESG